MSCYMISNEGISELAAMVKAVGEKGYSQYGFNIPEELYLEYRKPVENIARDLFEMNAEAVMTRYEDSEDMVGDFEFIPVKNRHPMNIRGGGADSWYFEMLARIRCYLYQCSEGSVPNRTLYKGMESLSDRIARCVMDKLPEMRDAMEKYWG